MVSLTEISPQEDLQPKTKPTPKKPSTSRAMMAQPRDILAFFLLFRLINAFCVRTFFQPDEYFQALEPAWSMAFGADSGAWLTWVLFNCPITPIQCKQSILTQYQEWQYQLRSSLHPALFGVAYAGANHLMSLLDFLPPVKASVLIALPKVIQSVFAATGDYYTWRLAGSLYGLNSNSAWAAVCFLTIFSEREATDS